MLSTADYEVSNVLGGAFVSTNSYSEFRLFDAFELSSFVGQETSRNFIDAQSLSGALYAK